MQCEKNMTAYAIALLAMASAFLMIPMDITDADTTEQDYDVDYGTFYSYTLQFVFDGKDAETIEWDFGDGSPTSDEWNPSHTYAEKGTYYVTQTTTNSYNGGSTTVEVYKVVIAGFPVISFEEDGGSHVDDIQQTAYKIPATEPPAPTRDGYTFGGWFTDTGLTIGYDWSSEVTRSITLHAKWIADIPDVPDTPDVPDNPDDPTDPDNPDTPTDPDDEGEHIVSFDVDGGSVELDPITVDDGSEIVLPEYNGIREGFSFGGWMVGDTLHPPGDRMTVTSDLMVEAMWNSVPGGDGEGSGDGDDGTGDGTGDGSDDDGSNDLERDNTDYLHLALVILGAVCLFALVLGSRRH